MRLLDPNLLTSETGKILVRDNAIVFSVEHVRLIITADCVIIPQTGFEKSSLSTQFAVMLEEAIIEASQEKAVGTFILTLVTASHVPLEMLSVLDLRCSKRRVCRTTRGLHCPSNQAVCGSGHACRLTATTCDPQARFAYERAMANRDTERIDEALARDYDDRMSDDSSGRPLLPAASHVSDSSMLCPASSMAAVSAFSTPLNLRLGLALEMYLTHI